MDKAAFERWTDAYVKAWNSNDPEDIRALFTDDATYLTGPFDEPWQGIDRIVEQWIEEKDEPGTTEFRYEVIAADGDTGVVQGVTDYSVPPPPRTYGNIWVIRLTEDGRASYYLEFYMLKRNEDQTG